MFRDRTATFLWIFLTVLCLLTSCDVSEAAEPELPENPLESAAGSSEAEESEAPLFVFSAIEREADHVYEAHGTRGCIWEKASAADFNACLQELEAGGYEKYASHERGKTLSATYTDGRAYVYHVFYEGGYGQLSILCEEYEAQKMPPKKAEYKKVCETQFVQLGLEYAYDASEPESKAQNGMCYIWRLEDGRFIIMDGGFYSSIGSRNIMDTLKILAADPNDITIASWIVTHFHGDHAGALRQFARTYLKRVKIESLIFHLPPEEQVQNTEKDRGLWERIREAIEKSGQDPILYWAHPGQIYHFANAEVEILYTSEMSFPAEIRNYNTCSLVTDVRFGDFNMMMLGDCSPVTNTIICANYGKALESEVVQVAHHGYGGGSAKLYERINPRYVFWPIGSLSYAVCEENARENPSTDPNAYFFRQNTRVWGIYLAKDLVTVMDVDAESGFVRGKVYKSLSQYKKGNGTEIPLPAVQTGK